MTAPFSNYPVNEAFERLMAQERAVRAARAQGAASGVESAQPKLSKLTRLLDWLCGIDNQTGRASHAA